jgi:hypothetical protein
MQSIGICGLREEFSELRDYFISDKVVYVADFFDSQFKVSRPLDSIDWLAKYDSGVVDLELKVFFFGNGNSHLFAIEEEIHYATLRASWPKKADELKAGLSFGADDVFELPKASRASTRARTRKAQEWKIFQSEKFSR